MPGCNKRKRTKNVSSGARKGRVDKNLGRQGPPIADQMVNSFLKSQARDRWPDQATADTYAALNSSKHHPGPPRKRPAPLIMPMLEALAFHTNPNVVNDTAKLLIAASLKVKRVRRHPGWILQRLYNHKGAPITII